MHQRQHQYVFLHGSVPDLCFCVFIYNNFSKAAEKAHALEELLDETTAC